ncbi:MAG TPA: hypothetical protein VND65_14385, partial [Candidatus Binatia bacterium]|nr:hypothetical protein [Candidatus Binatia bacterium]
TNPKQTCTVTNGSGTISGNVTNVQVTCSQPAFTISGSVVGLVPTTGQDTIELQDNAGDDLFVTGNTTFTFPTQVTNGGIYHVSIFNPPTSQPQPCTVFNGDGIAKGDVVNVIVDCQHNDWTWIDGLNTENNNAILALDADQLTVFPPIQSAPDVNNPGGRDFASTWTDLNGNKWLFGGIGFPLKNGAFNFAPGFLNDLWVFTEAPNVHGPAGGPAWVPGGLPNTSGADAGAMYFTDTNGVYGTLGTGTAGVTVPGARWGASNWTDGAVGDLWMFGGQGFDATSVTEGLLNDLWKFTPGAYDATTGQFTGTWTWVAGFNAANQAGIYGATPGTATASCATGTTTGCLIPGGRWAAATFTDKTGKVWFFGGQGYDSTGALGLLNDLWMWDPLIARWTWVAGTPTANQNGSYGTQGTAATACTGSNAPCNGPGGRQAAVLWTDSSNNVWLFGGFGLDSAGTANGVLNDLWKYSGGQWTWVSGGGASGLANQNGVYGTQTTPAAANVPGSRWGAVGWNDASNNLWFFGGWGYDSVATHGTGFLNDVWEYQNSSKQWIWWKGSSAINQNGTYSKGYGIPFVGWIAGARRGAALWQPDSLDYVWVFGGQGYDSTNGTAPGYLSDLWTYLPFP